MQTAHLKKKSDYINLKSLWIYFASFITLLGLTTVGSLLMFGLPTQKTLAYWENPANAKLPNATFVPVWQSALNRLLPTDYTRRLESDGRMILRSGRFRVELPFAVGRAEAYGQIMLLQLINCTREYRSVLGQDTFLPGEIAAAFIVNPRPGTTGACCTNGNTQFNYYDTRENFAREMSEDSFLFQLRNSLRYNQCWGNHELSHRFDRGTQMDIFTMEGLAEYLQDRFMSSSNYLHSSNYICGTNDWYILGNPRHAYASAVGDFSAPNFYPTGLCFWKRIADEFGDEKIREIMTNIYRMPVQPRLPESLQLFRVIREAVIPALGESYWNTLQSYGIFRPLTPKTDKLLK